MNRKHRAHLLGIRPGTNPVSEEATGDSRTADAVAVVREDHGITTTRRINTLRRGISGELTGTTEEATGATEVETEMLGEEMGTSEEAEEAMEVDTINNNNNQVNRHLHLTAMPIITLGIQARAVQIVLKAMLLVNAPREELRVLPVGSRIIGGLPVGQLEAGVDLIDVIINLPIPNTVWNRTYRGQ